MLNLIFFQVSNILELVSSMKKVILHCDLNCFFASVEMLYHPEFRNVPMAIAGDPENRHGIILAKNVPAKLKGVKTAEAIHEAKAKCPNLIIRTPNYQDYDYFSNKVRSLYYEYTDRVEPFGMDECWLDISESVKLFGSVENIVKQILQRVKDEIGLTLSIGIANNKIYAKLGSDLAKEDSYYIVDGLEKIKNLPANDLLNVGHHTYETLKSYGIYTIGDIAKKPIGYLKGILGKAGETLYYFANGYDLSEVSLYDADYEVIKSIGNSMTAIRDLYDIDDLKLILTVLCDSVSARLREQGMYFKVVHLYVRNKKLESRSAQITLKENSDLAKDIFDNAIMLFENNFDFTIPYRSIGVSVSKLSFQKEVSQIDLFEKVTYSLKRKNEELALENIRRRFGYHSISTLRVLEDTELSDFDPKNEHTFFPVSYFRK